MKKIILFAIAFFVGMCGTAETKDINLEGNFNVKKTSDSSGGGTGSLTVEKNATIMGNLVLQGPEDVSGGESIARSK